MVGDWVVEQVMYFGSRHVILQGLGTNDRSSSPLSFVSDDQEPARGVFAEGHSDKIIGLI